MPPCIGLSERSSSHASSGVGWPQSWPSRFASSAMIHWSSRASPGGSIALCMSCTRRSELVTVPPADSHHDAVLGKTTSAISHVLVIRMSWAIMKSRPSSSAWQRLESASDCAGFSPST